MSSNSSFDMMSDEDDYSSYGSEQNLADEVQPAQQKQVNSAPQQKAASPTRSSGKLLAFVLAFMLPIIFVGILIHSIPKNETVIVGKTSTKTINPTEFIDIPSLDERKVELMNKAEREMEMIDRARKLVVAKKRTSIKQFAEHEWDKWTPDPSRFVGVKNFLYKTEMIGTPLEDYLYTSNFKIDAVREEAENGMEWITHKDFQSAMKLVQYCKGIKDCFKSHFGIKDGDLHMTVSVTTEKESFEMTLVYYIPSKYLMKD